MASAGRSRPRAGHATEVGTEGHAGFVAILPKIDPAATEFVRQFQDRNTLSAAWTRTDSEGTNRIAPTKKPDPAAIHAGSENRRAVRQVGRLNPLMPRLATATSSPQAWQISFHHGQPMRWSGLGCRVTHSHGSRTWYILLRSQWQPLYVIARSPIGRRSDLS